MFLCRNIDHFWLARRTEWQIWAWKIVPPLFKWHALLAYCHHSMKLSQKFVSMMTSSNGNIFRVTGPLSKEFTGNRWIPITKARDAELALMFSLICAWINGWLNNRGAGILRLHSAHYDVIVMLSVPSTIGQHCFRYWLDSKQATRQMSEATTA